MVVNAKCNPCKEPTKYVAGFFDGPRGRRGCLFDCKNEQCEIYQVKRFTESEAVKERIKIQNLNSQKGMQAGYIAALRKDAKITMMKMSQIADAVLQSTVPTSMNGKSSIRKYTGNAKNI